MRLSIAAETAKFGQTGPRVGSFDGGYGASYLAAIVGQKKAREIWYLCRQYTAAEALDMGLVNKVVPFDELEAECVQWAREMLALHQAALRFPEGVVQHGDRRLRRSAAASPAMLRFCTTPLTSRRRKAAMPSRNIASPTSINFPEVSLIRVRRFAAKTD